MLGLVVTRKNLDKLETYRTKRQADRTPEPFSSSLPPSQRFVVQLHAARRRHYDFRLELDGVLKSWAVPKGPSPNPADKRLAVHVEDHPLEYVNFEGVIPEGNYGAGAVIVWDRGRWLPLNDPREGLESGKLLFELRGYKLRGKWTLVRTRQDWLLIKEKDAYVAEEGTEGFPPDSVRSGRTVEQLASGEDAAAVLRRQLAGLELEPLPAPSKLRPMLATSGGPFSERGWVFELKHDGYRLLASKREGKVTLYSRAGNDLTATFPEVADVLGALPYESFVMDGEVIVHDAQGLPSFARLQMRGKLTRRVDVARAMVELPATYYAFDLIGFDGLDLRPLKLLTRKSLLEAMLPSTGPLKFSEHIPTEGEAMFAQVERMGLEGIVAKRAEARYVSGRSRDWVKINAQKSDDFVVAGYAESEAGEAFAGLLLGQYDENDVLVYAGRVGTGFSAAERREIRRALDKAPRREPAAGAPPDKGLVWAESGLVAQVRFKARTEQGVLRQPSFQHLRTDKLPTECRLPSAQAVLEAPEPAALDEPEGPRVAFTNLDKVFWPAERYTKGDMIEYYRAVSPWLLPYLRDRPAVLTRYPDGIEGKSFYQKDAPVYAPDWVRLETMWSEQAQREIRYFVLDDLDSLLYVANMGSIPLHVWSSRVAALERPDWCILDLDPKGAPFADVVRIARFLLDLCKQIGLPAYVKTSGSTGLHILIPLGARYTYEHSRTLAELLARLAARKLSDIATVTRAVQARQGKVYVDYLQNGHGRLLVAPFSVRALPGAPVSMPIKPRQVTSRLRFARFNMRSVPGMLGRTGDPLKPVLDQSANVLEALEALEQHLAS
jgi:bifunctional non-homologous end joining protein LigD